MLNIGDIKITKVKTEKDYYDEKKKKRLKYKQPKITKRIVFEGHCYDIGEFYETLKFNIEKHLTGWGQETDLNVEIKSPTYEYY
tara:strand:- start:238 stop:489 length:252 start_codon:yes stop_codon:yes gene_type:complete